MIKFFGKIRQQLLTENKLSKYLFYALGEIALVMIGILLALQINNWNENRKNRIKEKALLNSIHKEFQMNRDQLNMVLSYHQAAMTSCEALIAMFPIDISSDDLEAVGDHVWNASTHWTFNPSQGSINGIMNTSSFDIISHSELRELLVSWQDLVLDYQEDELDGKAIVRDHLDPLFAKHVDFNFNLADKRNNLKILETLEFEFYVHLRLSSLQDILEGNEISQLKHSLQRIIDLTSPHLVGHD